MAFDDFLCKRNDVIYNAVYNCLSDIVDSNKKIEWDMSIIAPISEYVVEILNQNGFQICYPFHVITDNYAKSTISIDGETPCYLSTERCSFCKHKRGECENA